MTKPIRYEDLGNISYADAFSYQEELFQQMIERKRPEYGKEIMDAGVLLFCEHPHVITLGKSGDMENLLMNNQQLKEKGIEFFKTNRGGDITYHGPGQIVGYPIFDLDQLSIGVKSYMFLLEEVIIKTLMEFNIRGGRINEMTGVWLDYDHLQHARKICAMGVKISKWVTMHGFAFNVNTDLSYFETIVPCGIKGKDVTSLSKELGKKIPEMQVKEILLIKFEEVFKIRLTY